MNSEAFPACPCCGTKHLRRIGVLPNSDWFAGRKLVEPLGGGDLYRCQNCSMKFRYPLQPIGMYQQLYDNAATATWSENRERVDWDLISRFISQRVLEGGSILDIGCYCGGLLKRLGSKYQRYGIEINQTAAAVAEEGIQDTEGIVWRTVEDIPSAKRFNAIIAADVIEHFANPFELLVSIAGLLAEDGMVVITTGDADNALWDKFGANWWYCFYPEHISFVSERWFTYFAPRAGLSLVSCDRFAYRKSNPTRQGLNTKLTYFYGWFPKLYLALRSSLKRVLRRPGMATPPGNGVSRDHLFVVLSLDMSERTRLK